MGRLERQRIEPDPGKYMGRWLMAGPDGTGLEGETAVGAGYIIDQADLKSLRQSGVFCFWVPWCTPGGQMTG